MVVNFKKMETLLVNNDMSIKDLMEKSKISFSSITNIKEGKDVRIKTVSRIIKALNVSAEDIM